MFPVPTGMNRKRLWLVCRFSSVPRAHGDEPFVSDLLLTHTDVFPVPTGMNRSKLRRLGIMLGVPRAHGDEP